MSPERNLEQPFETMDFGDLECHPVYGPILQQKALEVLKSDLKDYFDAEYTGELDAEGYLIRKDGQSAVTKPSMNFSGGPAMEQVLKLVLEEIGKAT